MELQNDKEFVYELPPEIVKFRDLAQQIVREELLPLEQKYLAHPGHAYGLKETICLRAVFGDEVTNRLIKIARDTGLWYMLVPEDHGGTGLSLLAQVAI